MFANDLFLGHVPFPRTLTRSVRPYASVIIRRFSSKSALSISPRAKRSFRISMEGGEVSRVTRLSLLRRRGPQHKHHILDLRILIAPPSIDVDLGLCHIKGSLTPCPPEAGTQRRYAGFVLSPLVSAG